MEIINWARENLKTNSFSFEDENSYVKFLKSKWKEGFSKTVLSELIKDYSLYFAGIHYKSSNLLHNRGRILTEIFGNENIVSIISEELIGFEKHLLPLQTSDDHLAWIQILEDVVSIIHFKIGPSISLKKTQTIPFPENVLKFLVKNFEICHIDNTMSNIEKQLKENPKIKESISQLCNSLKDKMVNRDFKRILEEKGDTYIVKSLIISFYIVLTLLKKERYNRIRFNKKKSKIFNKQHSFHALFLPIYPTYDDVVAVLASLHHKELTNDECNKICELYAKFFQQFITWEQHIRESLPWIANNPTFLIQELKTSLNFINNIKNATDLEPLQLNSTEVYNKSTIILEKLSRLFP